LSFTISIDGIDELVSRLDAAGKSDFLDDSLESIGAELVTSKFQKYPPVPAGSRYARTNKLRGSWMHKASGGTLTISSGGVPYNRYVMDEDMQTHFHAEHGWNTAQGILRANIDRVKKIITKDLQKILGGG